MGLQQEQSLFPPALMMLADWSCGAGRWGKRRDEEREREEEGIAVVDRRGWRDGQCYCFLGVWSRQTALWFRRRRRWRGKMENRENLALVEWCVWSFSDDGRDEAATGFGLCSSTKRGEKRRRQSGCGGFHRRGERKREVGRSCKKDEKSRVLGSNVIDEESIGFNLDRRIRSK
ncbi:hypothetical protein HAX54_018378 [Datura stramonium]|uniref:Uncharacterized protein n=1 Tax=Datura stramonium TaxID=4076 RepID=A0ABS8UMD7_DATST|nr:hypothetical protein [Datura stramonium]